MNGKSCFVYSISAGFSARWVWIWSVESFPTKACRPAIRASEHEIAKRGVMMGCTRASVDLLSMAVDVEDKALELDWETEDPAVEDRRWGARSPSP